MDKEIVVHTLISILKSISKWLLILLAVICAVLILLATYLLVSELFYDGETTSLIGFFPLQYFPVL